MPTDYRNFLALSYEELEELNLKAKSDRMNRVAADEVRACVPAAAADREQEARHLLVLAHFADLHVGGEVADEVHAVHGVKVDRRLSRKVHSFVIFHG